MHEPFSKTPGADCTYCALREQRFVPDEVRPEREFVIVGEAPGAQEVRLGKPFIGASGALAIDALRTTGRDRRHFSWLNVVHCQPPGNKLEDARRRASAKLKIWQQECKDAKRAKTAPPEQPLGSGDPIVCCRGAVRHSLLRTGDAAKRGIFAFGDVPMRTLLQLPKAKGTTISAKRGFPERTRSGLKVFPTFHPAFILRARQYMPIFEADLAKGIRYFHDRLRWREPRVALNPNAAFLERYFSRDSASRFAFDVETDGKFSPLVTRIRCIGFCRIDTVREAPASVVVALRSIDAERGIHEALYSQPTAQASPFYDPIEFDRVLTLLGRWLTRLSAEGRLLGWNANYFDRMALMREFALFGVPLDLQRIDDGIMQHREVNGELPHGLGFVGSYFTDVDNWKSEHTATEAKSDSELWSYNARDTVVNALLDQPLTQRVDARGQREVYEKDLRVQSEICTGLHQVGMYVDQEIRQQLEDKYVAAEQKLRTRMLEILRAERLASMVAEFNPGSTKQIIQILFDEWKLDPPLLTATGNPSTNADSLIALMRAPGSALRGEFLNCVRLWRRYAQKYLGTYLLPAAGRIGDYGDDGEEDEDSEDSRRRWLFPDGRVHSNYNAHVAVTGRLSSSVPNMQNVVPELRAMFVPEPGNVFVTCDSSQIELRLVAAVAGAKAYIHDFETGADPHARQAEILFGDFWRNCTDALEKKRIRTFTKMFQYSSAYSAGDKTVWEIIVSSEGKDGGLPFADTQMKDVSLLRKKWLAANPEIPLWWDSVLNEFHTKQYITEPIWGRRRDFTTASVANEEFGGKSVMNEVINFGIQGAASAIIHDATFEVIEEFPFFFAGPGTGLTQQGHDALVLECPKADAPRALACLKEHMTRRYEGLDVTFTCEANETMSWAKAA